MKQRILKIDQRIDAVHEAERASSSADAANFRKQLHASWVYNDLHIEGVPLTKEELDRALEGLEGLDHCDRERMSHVRRMDRALRILRLHAQEGRQLNFEALKDYVELVTGEEAQLRASDGATEAYKHDVVAPKDAIATAEAAFEKLNEFFHDEHPLELAFDLHESLCEAWPFQVGSAVAARLVVNEVLLSHGYPPLIFAATSRQTYYQSLHHDIRRFADLALDTIEKQLDLREKIFAAKS